MLSIRTLSRGGLVPAATDPWPPTVRRLLLEGSSIVLLIRPAAPPAALRSLELTGLPRPDGGLLAVPIERLPFHHSPGRWHFRCPACGQLRGVLVEACAEAPPPARALGWACRTCVDLPASRAWPLGPAERLDNALERATEERRRPGEKACDWRRRRLRAEEARRKAAKVDAVRAEGLAAEVDLVDP